MKTALIPPFEMLGDVWKSTYQLMLPQLIGNKQYADTYRALCADPNQYVILDNGAAEGVPTDMATLYKIAYEYGVNEVVLPDKIGTYAESLDATLGALRWLAEHSSPNAPFKYMAVIQGTTIAEMQHFLDGVRWCDDHRRVTVWGIPRHLLLTTGNTAIRLQFAEHMLGGRDIFHLLGTNPIWVREASYASVLPNIRGVDTSAPYVYGSAHAPMNAFLVHKRPKDYFEKKYTSTQRGAMKDNVKDYLGWQS